MRVAHKRGGSTQTSLDMTADVLVCGGGVAGTVAAVAAAARAGARVLLVER